jgi:hypothetical protein
VHVSLYLVERVLPGITMPQLGAFIAELAAASRQMTAAGERVHYLRSTFLPGPSRCLCLFDAATPQLVKELNDRIQFPYAHILSVLELAPEEGTATTRQNNDRP